MSHAAFLPVSKRIQTWTLAAFMVAGLASCGGDGSAPVPRTENAAQASVVGRTEALTLAPSTAQSFTAQVTSAPANLATISGSITLQVEGANLANVELLPASGYTPKYAVFSISPDKTKATVSLDTTKLPDGNLVARISAFDAPAGSSAANEIVAMPARTWTIKNNSSGTPSTSDTSSFAAQLTAAPANGATVSGIVNLEVKGTNIANVELLPEQGYTPKLAIFTVSGDKTTATAKLDTTKLPNGKMVARISAFDTPAGSSTAREIVAMSARTWNINNGEKPQPGTFSATLASAPANGATISGNVSLEVRGSKLKNVELLPSEGYIPKYAVFSVSPDGTKATATLDTTKLPDGLMVARISAFDAPAGSPANEIVLMPSRGWSIKNKSVPASFTAQATQAPANNANISGIVRLEVTGSNLENVELLPASGYTPKYAVFSISPDKTKATVDFDTTKISNGELAVRISAFNEPAGSATASEIVAMPVKTWIIANGSTPPPPPSLPTDDASTRLLREFIATHSISVHAAYESREKEITRIASANGTLCTVASQDLLISNINSYAWTNVWDAVQYAHLLDRLSAGPVNKTAFTQAFNDLKAADVAYYSKRVSTQCLPRFAELAERAVNKAYSYPLDNLRYDGLIE